MNIIKKYIRYFNDEYIQKIEHNKELLIKAFVKYYGVEFEDKIRTVFNKTNYFWYVSNFNSDIKKKISRIILDKELVKIKEIAQIIGIKINFNNMRCQLGDINISDKISITSGKIITTGDKKVDMILETLFGEDKLYKDDKNCPFNQFFLYDYNERERVIEKIFSSEVSYNEGLSKIMQIKEFLTETYPLEKEKLNSYLYFYIFEEYIKDNSKIIGSTTDKTMSVFEKEKIAETVKNIIIDKKISCPFSVTLSEDIPVVAFNALLTSDLNFIHEINHSIKSSIFAYKMDDSNVSPIKKSGICIYDNDSLNADILEEILNDIEAKEVTDIFHGMGGNLFDEDILKHRFMNSNSYPKYYPLVIRFYSLYKDLIKDASITEDANILYKRINKEKFDEYAKFIDYVYKNYFDDEIPLEFIDKANKMIDDLSLDLKDEMNIDDYIKELEESGKKVQRLN